MFAQCDRLFSASSQTPHRSDIAMPSDDASRNGEARRSSEKVEEEYRALRPQLERLQGGVERELKQLLRGVDVDLETISKR